MRLITVKVWLHPDLGPSLVGGAVESISSQNRHSSIIISIFTTFLSPSFSSSIPTRSCPSRRGNSVQSPVVVDAWLWGRLPNSSLFRAGKKRLRVPDKCCLCWSENEETFHGQRLTFKKFNFKLNRGCFSSPLPCFISLASDQVSLWESGPLD